MDQFRTQGLLRVTSLALISVYQSIPHKYSDISVEVYQMLLRYMSSYQGPRKSVFLETFCDYQLIKMTFHFVARRSLRNAMFQRD